jgi:alpha-maltose-1-phosphate synthase
MPTIQFHIVGSGPIDPTAWGLPNVSVHGTQTPDDVASLMQACDGFILPSIGEGYPLVVQEAMACGLTVFCGDETARADPAASQYLHGAHVDLADPVASAAGFITAIQSATLRHNKAAADFAHARYNWGAGAKTIVELLRAKAAQ